MESSALLPMGPRQHLYVLAIALALFPFLVLPSNAQTYVSIRVVHANAREAPNPNATILAVLSQGEIYRVTGDVPYWYEIILTDGRPAFVAKSLCSVVDDPGEGNTEEDIGQPLSELYSIPPTGSTLTVPNCTPTTLNVNWSVCPAEGNGGANRLANIQKNRVAVPCSFTVMTVEQILNLRNLTRTVRTLPASDERRVYLQNLEARPVVVEGYLAMVKKSGPESTNCNSSSRKDLHVELVATDQGDPKDNRNRVLVTEVSPWFSEAHASWTGTSLGDFASYKGGYSGNFLRAPMRVRIYGWLFFDNWHADGSVGTWRGTAWEIHPIARIEVWENSSWRSIP